MLSPESLPRLNSDNKYPALSGVKNIIAVASGKGGVGKSATSVNLACTLVQNGFKVGLLDADIYGPSTPMMLGIGSDQRPKIEQQKFFHPIVAHGVASMSMGYLVTEKTPMVWRGPMASGALVQMLNQTIWGELDFLLIDMPPGTGDIQLTLAQQSPCSAAVIVTTPQSVALLDAQKGIEMFQKVAIPCLGVIENMSIYQCKQCGHEEAIFGEKGGQRLADSYNTKVLGALPIDIDIRDGADVGIPVVVSKPESSIAAHYQAIAAAVFDGVVSLASNKQSGPTLSVVDD